MRFRALDALQACRSPEGGAYALRLKYAADIVATTIYLRQRGASSLLLHGDTPLAAALELAAAAGCRALLTGPPLQAMLPEREVEPAVRLGAAPSLLQFSSGTTGSPKLITRPWDEIEREIGAYNRRLAPSGGEPPLILVPVSHSYGLIAGVMAGLARDVTPHIIGSGNPKAALRHIRNEPEGIVYAVPFLYQLLDSLSKGEVRYRKAVSSGAPLTEALLARLKASAGELWQQYGCSELGCIALGHDPDSPEDVGLPLQHLSVRIARSADVGAEGEIVVAGPDGERATGDLGAISSDGRLQVLGRLDDLINVSGRKVVPAEVERTIAGMIGVREAVVYGSRHPVWGEAVSAWVVADSGIGAESIREYCARRLEAYKVPHAVRLVAEIPRTESGKISRKSIGEREE